MWGWFIGLFVGIWLLQILLTSNQNKHYKNTIREMSKRTSGYLGVGVKKEKLGIGMVVILVTDDNGIVIEGKRMEGVTVFASFKELNDFNGMSLNNCKKIIKDNQFGLAVGMAIEKIQAQMEKTQPIG